MTLTESDLGPRAAAGPIPVVAEVDGIPVSGLLAAAPAPRAVLVALHGGATTSAYFDCPGHPELSLLRLGQRLGYTVLALDRPGYGASGPFADRLLSPRRRVDLMYGAVEAHLDNRPRGAGVFLLAHSAGCELALRMAADERGRGLLGLELAGTGRTHHPEAQEVLWGPRPAAPGPLDSGRCCGGPRGCIHPSSWAVRPSPYPAPGWKPPPSPTGPTRNSRARPRECASRCGSARAITRRCGATTSRN
ncbi:alpha/beta fold hydrolase [Nocardia asiatica]|uniref:alpha/beta fold hydrolase n=1 Tax=Nocardia asiatica TaxID=209252 RepID=UPI002453CACC|nr:alpha/beta fold hydrolase [Nocardia asiatica]